MLQPLDMQWDFSCMTMDLYVCAPDIHEHRTGPVSVQPNKIRLLQTSGCSTC